jgi:hypothetical protein
VIICVCVDACVTTLIKDIVYQHIVPPSASTNMAAVRTYEHKITNARQPNLLIHFRGATNETRGIGIDIKIYLQIFVKWGGASLIKG